jgi:hypothetical protein
VPLSQTQPVRRAELVRRRFRRLLESSAPGPGAWTRRPERPAGGTQAAAAAGLSSAVVATSS